MNWFGPLGIPCLKGYFRRHHPAIRLRDSVLRCKPRDGSPEQVRTAGAGYLLEHGVGELPDSSCEGDVAGGGGVGLAAVGEPVQEDDELLPGGQAGLVGTRPRRGSLCVG